MLKLNFFEGNIIASSNQLNQHHVQIAEIRTPVSQGRTSIHTPVQRETIQDTETIAPGIQAPSYWTVHTIAVDA
jgi:hypothetical protein